MLQIKVDEIPQNVWQNNCILAQQYLNFLQSQYAQEYSKGNVTSLTLERFT
jgi:hypothetical protein